MAFKHGDIVKVTKRGLWSTGRSGTVMSATDKRVDVLVNGGYGYLSYRPSSLQLVISSSNNNAYNGMCENKNNNKKGEDNMLMGNYKVATVKFVEGTNTEREYHYALYNDGIYVGDYVVVKSANHGMGIAVVTKIMYDDEVTQKMRDYCNEGREIIASFDMNAYNERVAKRKRAKELKVEMNKKMKEMQELAMFEMMAEKNPELKEMLDAYKELIM